MTISLRHESPADAPFLSELYAETRQHELEFTGWDAATRQNFLENQFRCRELSYRSMFPGAAFSIILLEGIAIGRLVVDRSATEIRVVDVAIDSLHRGRGIGTKLLKSIIEEARSSGKPVRLHALRASRELRLYLRLGFVHIGEFGFHDELELLPEPT